MANKIGIVLALDKEKEFTQGMKNATESVKLCKQEEKNLQEQFKDSANTLEALTKKQEALSKTQEAYKRALDQAKNGQKHAVDNYKKCGKALEDLKKDLEKAEDALKDMERTGDTSSKTYQDQKRAVENLQRAVEKQSAEYAKAEGNITKWDTKVSKAKSDVEKNSKAVDKNAKHLDEAKNSADHCATSIDKFGKEVREAGEDADKAGGKVQTLGQKIKDGMAYKLGAMATQGLAELGDKAVEAAKYVVDVGSSFEASMSNVEALSGAAGGDLDALSRKAQELGASTKFSATEVADAFGYMALAGWDTKSMLDGIDGVLDLAASSGMDLAEASDMVTDNLSAFGLQAQDSTKFADELAYAQSNSNTTAEQLGDAFQRCASNMAAAGQDVETTTSFLAAFADQGLKGHEAGTKLAAIMRDIARHMEDGAIEINGTSIAVQDANGNFRDLTDIMGDVEAATYGMGDAERAAELQSIFTADSIQGINMILQAGVDDIGAFEEALRNSDGTAANVANTMQDNLKGAVTELGSATEGLGIALYDHVSGPLTSAVDLATNLISGITKAITPQKTELEAFIDDIGRGNSEVQGLLDSAEKEVANAEAKVGELEVYKDTILELQAIINNGGELDTYQLYQMQNAVNAVKDDVPGIGENFDAVTGKIDLSTKAIEDMFKAAEQGAMNNALMKAMESDMQAYADALVNQAKATAAAKEAQKELDEYVAQYGQDTITRLSQNINDPIYQGYQRLKDAANTANAAVEESGKQAEQAQKEMDLLKQASADLTKEQGQLADEMNGNATATEGARQEHLALKKAQQETASSSKSAASALDDESDSADDAAKAVQDAAKAQYDAAKEIQSAHETAAKTISEAYDSAKSSIDQALGFNAFEEWEQDSENGISKLQQSLDSQVQGLTKYAENLQTVTNHVGHEITPEFLQYLQDMGTDGAQLMQELANALSTGDTGKVEKLMNSYTEAMDKKDEISSVMAANKVAAQIGAKELGSTEIEWTGVDNAVSYLQEAGGKISDETLSAFQQAEAAAQEAGVKIPDGLVSGIEAGVENPEQALSHATDLLEAAIEGQASGLLEIAQNAGIQIPQSIQDGIAAGGDAAQTAMTELLSLISEAASDAEGTAQEAGETVGDAVTTAVEDKESAASSAGSILASGAATGAKGKTSEMTSAGTSLGSSLANGINSQQGAARGAGMLVAMAARSGASGVGGFSGIGANMASGIASGIRSNGSAITDALVAQVHAAVAAAKNAAQIKSPSRVFRDQVGKQISAGIAVGIKQSTKDTVDAATAQMNKTLAAVQAWAVKNKAKFGGTGQQWADNVAYMWQKLADVEVRNKFGISKTKKSSNGKTEKKSTEEYYNDIYRAAQQYMKNVQALYHTSDKQELEYWKKVKKGLKRGTQAWFDACAEIQRLQDEIRENEKQAAADARAQILSDAETYVKEQKDMNRMSVSQEVAYWRKIREQLKRGTEEWKTATQNIIDCKERIGTIKVADTILDNYSTYYDVSLKAEMDYWYKVRLQYSAGTEKRIEADQKYLAAKKKYNEKLKDIEDDYAEKIADTNQKYTDALKSRKEDILSSYDLFDYFESSSATGDELLYNLQTQARGYEEWNKSIEELQNKGILSDDLIKQLIDRGPSSIASIKALLTLTNDQLKEYQKAYNDKEAVAEARAKKDTADLKTEVANEIKDLKKQQSRELADINREINADLLSLADNIRSIAEDQTSALVAAFVAVGSQMAASTGNSVSSTVTGAAGISQAIINGAQQSVNAQQKGQSASEAVKAVSAAAAKKVADAEKAVETAKNAYEKAKAATSSAKSKQASAKATLTEARNSLSGLKKSKMIITDRQRQAAEDAVNRADSMYKMTVNAVHKAQAAETAAQNELLKRQKALSALRAQGYRSGSRRIGTDGLIWMDEALATAGPEMIVRKNDNAILTRAQASDAIIPANLVDNLFKWGAIDPTTLNTASMASLNQRLLEGYQASMKANTQQVTRLDQMLSLMSEFMPYLADRMTAPIQSRDAVTVMSNDISRDMAARARRHR